MCNTYIKNSEGFDIKGQRKRLDVGDLNGNMKGISTNAKSLDQAWPLGYSTSVGVQKIPMSCYVTKEFF